MQTRLSPSLRVSSIPAVLTAIAAAIVLSACGGSDDSDTTPPVAAPLANQLYTQTNDTANAIVHFTRQANGTLVRAESTPTGGAGTDAVGASGATAPDSLAGQHSVVLSTDAKTLFTVNGGDDSISALSIDQSTGALTLLKKSPATAGHIPNSLAYNNGYLYATFLSGTNALAAYKVGSDGSLTQVAAYNLNTVPGVSGASPTQVIATPDGTSIVVDAGTASGSVLSFPINADGSLGTAVANTSLVAPFAGAFLPQKTNPIYLATSASQDALTEFTDAAGQLNQVSQASTKANAPAVAAPCWLVLSPDGSVAFVGNGSGSLSTYSVSATSGLTLSNATAATEPGVKTGVNSVAADSWVSPDGKYLYTAYLGDDKIVAYAIGLNGSLAKLGESVIGTSTGISIQGLVGI
jgi:6-phosphogluconolactonase (cycloisomerase 2 family)